MVTFAASVVPGTDTSTRAAIPSNLFIPGSSRYGIRYRMITVKRCLALTCALAFARSLSAKPPVPDGFALVLERLRSVARIPGMSAVVVQDGRVVLKRGFGSANLEK